MAVDPNFDSSATANESADANADDNSQDQSLKYKGHMRVLGNLVWSELYPMLAPDNGELSYLWPQARDHPEKVYTGLTVPSQVEPWREMNSMKRFMMDGFVEFLKKKDPTLAAKLEDVRKGGVFSI